MEIEKDEDFKKAEKVIKEWAERLGVFEKRVMAEIGKEMLKRVKAGLKPRFWWQKVYKSSLRAEYAGGKEEHWVAVYGDRPKGVRELDADHHLIWFREVLIRGEEPLVDFLKKYEPWTVDFLPSIRGDRYPAKAWVKWVSTREVAKRRKVLRRLRPEIEKGLEELKIRPKLGVSKLAGRTAFDLEFSVLSQEFHRGGKPVWKPVVRRLKEIAKKSVKSVGTRILTDPGEDWRKAEELKPLDEEKIPGLIAFTDKIVGRSVREV